MTNIALGFFNAETLTEGADTSATTGAAPTTLKPQAPPIPSWTDVEMSRWPEGTRNVVEDCAEQTAKFSQESKQ